MAAARYKVVQVCLVVAAAYYMTGVLGLMLAIPPGFATLFWPPAGIALGAAYLGGWRVAPGIWLGSFFVNFWIPGHGSEWICGAVPATGAAVSAVVGGWGMRQLLPEPWIWNPTQLLRFFFVASLAAGLNAIFAPSVLSLLGCVEHADLMHQIETWWSGDAIGMCIFTPVVVFMAQEMTEHAEES